MGGAYRVLHLRPIYVRDPGHSQKRFEAVEKIRRLGIVDDDGVRREIMHRIILVEIVVQARPAINPGRGAVGRVPIGRKAPARRIAVIVE